MLKEQETLEGKSMVKNYDKWNILEILQRKLLPSKRSFWIEHREEIAKKQSRASWVRVTRNLNENCHKESYLNSAGMKNGHKGYNCHIFFDFKNKTISGCLEQIF